MTAAEQARDAIARVLWDAVNDGAVALAVPSLKQADALLASRDPAVLAALADHLATVAPDTLREAQRKHEPRQTGGIVIQITEPAPAQVVPVPVPVGRCPRCGYER